MTNDNDASDNSALTRIFKAEVNNADHHHGIDLYGILRELVQERARLQQVIELLESPGKSTADARSRRRGRKSMNGPAREEVSQRMKRYWAQKKGTLAASG